MTIPSLDTMNVEVDSDTATVTLNRPGRANAVSRQLLRDLIEVCDWLGTRSDIHFLILTNAGHVFCAGQDLVELREDFSDDADIRANARSLQNLAQEMMRKMESLEQISFVGMRGSAYGAGLAIAITGDFRVMSQTSVGNLPEVKLGMFLTYGSLPRLVNMVGLTKAKEFVMFAEDASAQELLELGVVEHVVPDEEVIPLIRELIAKLREMDYRALRITKRVAHAAAAPQVGDVMHSEPDLVEGSLADLGLLKRLDTFFERERAGK